MGFERTFILTGAGISAESGIPTFRDTGGLWEGMPMAEVATPEAFARQPDVVYEFYNQRRRQLLNDGIEPNDAHRAIARWQAEREGRIDLVTQNVDNLHERAGSENVVHMHGELLKARCERTGTVFDWRDDLDGSSTPADGASEWGRLRPHLVWFGEVPLHMDDINAALAECELFIAIGTSGVVYPAAQFVQQVPRHARKVEINPEPTPVEGLFDLTIRDTAARAVPDFLATL
jgi:NAD-dependent deacetylase